MDLHGIVRGAITTVNPDTQMTWRRSQGYSNAAGSGGKVVLSYLPDQTVMGQAQALDADDLKQIDGLNLEGVKQAVYLYGNVQGLVRADSKTGDLLVFPQRGRSDAQSWRIIHVFETWPDWCKVGVWLQA